MPRSQVAAIGQYDVNAPVGAAAADKVEVLQFRQRSKHGGNLQFRFEPATQFGGQDEDAESDVEVSVEVSEDGVTFVATTATDNGAAVTDEAVVALSSADFHVRLRSNLDNYVRVLARSTGLKASRLGIQVRGDADLELVREGQDLTAKGPEGF